LIYGGCTTYVAALAVEKLVKSGFEFADYPNLVRLNPNIPWKSRGNGAVALRIYADEPLKPFSLVVETLRQSYAREDLKNQPGIVAFKGVLPSEIKSYALRALFDVVEVEEVERLVERHGVLSYWEKGKRGLIGALAAIGLTLDQDYTFELLTYRTRENYGKKRKVRYESVVEMDRVTKPLTFNNLDYAAKRLLITPHGPDPVLYGVRGETPEVLLVAKELIKADEPIERWIIFRTNHGTDMHFVKKFKVSELRPYVSAVVEGVVVKPPKTIAGGHVIFRLADETGEVDVAAYEPTGELRKSVKELIVGDRVEVYGGVKPPRENGVLTINLEKLITLQLVEKTITLNPKCPKCGKRMKSEGKAKGFRCEKCGLRLRNAEKEVVKLDRALEEMGIYLASPKAHRHLTKPKQRYGLEKRGEPFKLIEKWHEP
ncbi:MAG: DNA-binding protein, partial [Candidatus Methanomethylicota archaeon]